MAPFLILRVEGIHVLWNLQKSGGVCELDCLHDIYCKTLPVNLARYPYVVTLGSVIAV